MPSRGAGCGSASPARPCSPAGCPWACSSACEYWGGWRCSRTARRSRCVAWTLGRGPGSHPSRSGWGMPWGHCTPAATSRRPPRRPTGRALVDELAHPAEEGGLAQDVRVDPCRLRLPGAEDEAVVKGIGAGGRRRRNTGDGRKANAVRRTVL